MLLFGAAQREVTHTIAASVRMLTRTLATRLGTGSGTGGIAHLHLLLSVFEKRLIRTEVRVQSSLPIYRMHMLFKTRKRFLVCLLLPFAPSVSEQALPKSKSSEV